MVPVKRVQVQSPLKELRSHMPHGMTNKIKEDYGTEEASLVAQMVKNPPAIQETWVGKIPWRREWLPTPVFLPGEFHGQRSLAGYGP